MAAIFSKRAATTSIRSIGRYVTPSTRSSFLDATQTLPRAVVTATQSKRSFAINARSRYPGLMPDSENPEPPKNEATGTSRTAASLEDDDYHRHADELMNKINERAEEVAEQRDDVEVEFSAGVITITMPPSGTYVINKQPPNKQIWLASPLSGPKRFDWSIEGESMDHKEGSGTGEWVYLRDGTTLSDLLRKELLIDVTVGNLEEQLSQKSTDPVE